MKNKFKLVFCLILVTVMFVKNIECQIVTSDSLPGIGECQMLKGDFHMHTYYSDGYISPAERVEEAIREGFDIISITDHIEYRIFTAQHPGDHNQSYKEALDYANGRIVLVKGSELTRGMPPGHINVLFITDANQLDRPDLWEVLNIAKKQGAFFIWNHPGWKAQLKNGPLVWSDYHTKMLNENLLDGIEVYNTKEYYDSAYYWAIGKNLTVFANSDLHDRSENIYNNSTKRRPFTLVFSKDRELGSIKAALKAKRTIAVSTDSLFCTDENIVLRFMELSSRIYINNDNFELKNIGKCKLDFESISTPDYNFSLKPNETVFISKTNTKYKIRNFFVGPNKNATIDLSQLKGEVDTSVNNNSDIDDVIEVYPSPCSRTAKVKYLLAKNTNINIKIFNILGQQMRSIDYGLEIPGIHEESFDFSKYSNGIYIMVLDLGGVKKFSKVIVSR